MSNQLLWNGMACSWQHNVKHKCVTNLIFSKHSNESYLLFVKHVTINICLTGFGEF